jgi:hypothetical protein
MSSTRRSSPVVVAGCTLAIAALVPSLAHAQAAQFSEQGHLTISSDANVAITGQSYSGNGAPGSTFQLTLLPAVDYFVIHNLSIGGFLEYAHTTQNGTNGGPSTSSDTFGIGPRVGYNIGITDSISFWPKVFLAFASTNTSQGNNSGGDDSWTIGIYAPFLYHPAEHFFLGLGPLLSTQISNTVSAGNQSGSGPTATTYGIEFTVGGWVGL